MKLVDVKEGLYTVCQDLGKPRGRTRVVLHENRASWRRLFHAVDIEAVQLASR